MPAFGSQGSGRFVINRIGFVFICLNDTIALRARALTLSNLTPSPITMADSAKPRSPHSPSFIPVVAPRPTRSTLPSSLSLPQLNLGPTPRRPSASSPSVAAIPVASSSNIPQTPGSAVSPFRSLRNLLPFGGGKQQASSIQPNGISNTPRTSFSNFGSVRRSMTGERKNSISTPRVEVSEPLPVISIGSSPQHTDTETDHDTLPYDSRSSSGDLQHSPSGQVRDIGKPTRSSCSHNTPLIFSRANRTSRLSRTSWRLVNDH